MVHIRQVLARQGLDEIEMENLGQKLQKNADNDPKIVCLNNMESK